MENIVLASASPRRKQLMRFLGVPFIVKPSPVDEKQLVLSGPPSQQVMDAAQAKAEAVAATERDQWVLAADTVVCIDGKILGKPEDRADARRMLAMLSGIMHVVTTGLCLIRLGLPSPPAVYEETKVWMMPLSEAQILSYIDTGEPMDKAGAYGIQGYGSVWIPRIEGCYFNVMGLPIFRVARLMEEAGIGPVMPSEEGGAGD